jgi:hypothetical protein
MIVLRKMNVSRCVVESALVKWYPRFVACGVIPEGGRNFVGQSKIRFEWVVLPG